MKWQIHIRLPTSSANLREHWTKRKRRAADHRFVIASTIGNRIRGHVPCVVTLTRCAPRQLDTDNLAGAFKHIRDAVADCLGVDDRDSRITWQYEQKKAPYSVRIDVVQNHPNR